MIKTFKGFNWNSLTLMENKNLLNTKQICHDIINRITFKYEDKPYLKKYIATRVEEMVDINNLLDEDDD